ncbi:hypothetical protein P691DRAFT_790318 [Macrolepiota fuliginosa MF-IS2]|uniref:Uncharacterized protein n=1 Tax=Macrolepiota fuliginosa MF-IS2 TaxID=1400762 RepID=A0A9P6BXX6_9AGAR|nr:hypothetical protein P691DRAFT_790318 [Macrolepiota fuliginosa MF-IS2]
MSLRAKSAEGVDDGLECDFDQPPTPSATPMALSRTKYASSPTWTERLRSSREWCWWASFWDAICPDVELVLETLSLGAGVWGKRAYWPCGFEFVRVWVEEDWGWVSAREKGGCLASMDSRLDDSTGRDGGGAEESKRARAGLEYSRGDDTLLDRTRGRNFWMVFIVAAPRNYIHRFFRFTPSTRDLSHITFSFYYKITLNAQLKNTK